MSDQKAPVPAGKFYGFDHIHFWVGNAKQAAAYYIARFGFEPYAYRGLETDNECTVVSHAVKQDKIIFVFSSPLRPGNKEMGQHMEQHGDGVRDVAFLVSDAKAIYEAAVKNGAKSVSPPKEYTDEGGKIVIASIQTYGDTIHTLVQRDGYKGFLPGFQKPLMEKDPLAYITDPVGLIEVDHVVGNQDWYQMNPVVEWYKEKLGFKRFWSVDDRQIHTEYSALNSIVMTDVDEKVKMPINEPAKGKKVSQIEEFVEFYGGPGVQHIALRTNDIITSIKRMKARGVEFLSVPPAYYDNLKKRLENAPVKVKEDLNTIAELGILVDFDDKGYLLQLFTKPLEDRPTLFIEIIQRVNNSGFGIGNFKALFQSIEEEQKRRGTLKDSKQ